MNLSNDKIVHDLAICILNNPENVEDLFSTLQEAEILKQDEIIPKKYVIAYQKLVDKIESELNK